MWCYILWYIFNVPKCWCPRLVPKKILTCPGLAPHHAWLSPSMALTCARLRSLVRGELQAVARWWVELVVLFESKRHSFSSIGWRCSLKFPVNQLSRHHWAQQLVWGYLGSRGFTNCFQALEVMEKKETEKWMEVKISRGTIKCNTLLVIPCQLVDRPPLLEVLNDIVHHHICDGGLQVLQFCLGFV